MRQYDAVIVGAGIQGSGIAQSMALYGQRVLIIDNTAVAAGTSSQSSKLIHGGLRYLETGQLRLVRESLHERDLLLKLAPDLVKLVPFHIPIYKTSKRSPWQIQIGLQLYRMLDNFRPHSQFSRVPASEWHELDGLETKDLLAVFRYYDAQTDDAALTSAVLASAQKLGADVSIPAEIEQIKLVADGCEIRLSGSTETIYCKVLINATGPWAASWQQQHLPELAPLNVELVQGTHLLLDEQLTQGIYYLEAPRDGRAIFAMSWQGKVLLGTTETPYSGKPENVHPLPEEKLYLEETYRHYFPNKTTAKVLRYFCGLRVLPSSSSNPFKRSREIILQQDRKNNPRVVTIVGGKLTSYRATAEKVTTIIAEQLGIDIKSKTTTSIYLR